MAQYTVFPLIGFDDVKFGMSRSEVRNILGSPEKEFKKSKFSKNTTDDFGDFHTFYNADDQFEAVEFFKEAEIQDNKGNIFPKSINDVECLPYKFINDGDSYINEEYSIGIFAPDNFVESILFGIKDYY